MTKGMTEAEYKSLMTPLPPLDDLIEGTAMRLHRMLQEGPNETSLFEAGAVRRAELMNVARSVVMLVATTVLADPQTYAAPVIEAAKTHPDCMLLACSELSTDVPAEPVLDAATQTCGSA